MIKAGDLAPVEVTDLLRDIFEQRQATVPPWVEVTKKLLVRTSPKQDLGRKESKTEKEPE